MLWFCDGVLFRKRYGRMFTAFVAFRAAKSRLVALSILNIARSCPCRLDMLSEPEATRQMGGSKQLI